MTRAATQSKSQAQEDSDYQTVIVAYLKKQNRPYNATDIFNNLKGSIAKASVIKSLATTADQKLILSKTYGKQIIYAPIQNHETSADIEDMVELEAALETALKDLALHREIVSAYLTFGSIVLAEIHFGSLELAILTKSPTTHDMQVAVESFTQKNQILDDRLQVLSSGQQLVPPKQIQMIKSQYIAYRQEWKCRYKMFKNAWTQIYDGSRNEEQKLMSIIGIETDADVGVKYEE
ncbi:PSMC3 interacting protein [Batrachochytrium dendrobatidis]